jgi:hypothetical protein
MNSEDIGYRPHSRFHYVALSRGWYWTSIQQQISPFLPRSKQTFDVEWTRIDEAEVDEMLCNLEACEKDDRLGNTDKDQENCWVSIRSAFQSNVFEMIPSLWENPANPHSGV